MKKKIITSKILRDTFGAESRWVNFRIEERRGQITKLPYAVNGRLASSTDPKSWSTYEEARAKSENIGIVFTPDQKLLGIDIDHCLEDNQITHEQKEKIRELIIKADTYTEVSPSGKGLHLFLKISGDGLVLIANKRAPYEVYTSGRYFTVTTNAYEEDKPIREISPDEALKILAIIGYPWKKKEEVETAEARPISLDDATILQKMFTSKNGGKIKSLYEGDTSAHNGDESSADLALCSHLAFWTGKDRTQMERLWIESPLAQRKKTQKRKDYRDRTINAAVANCREVYETPTMKVEREVKAKAPELDLLFVLDAKANKIFIQNTENMCRVLQAHEDFKGRFRFDAFKNVYEIRSKNDMDWRALEDVDVITIQTAISIIFPSSFGKVGKDMIQDAILKVAREHTIDSAVDYITAIKWDRTPRLNEWLSKTYGVPNDEYHQSVGSNWMKGLVKRIIEPGCKFDYVLVLEGVQGSKKSTSLAILGGDWHVETTMSTDNKDFFMQFQGKAIVEFSEGETMSRTEVKKMKAIITTQVDRYRAPWGKTSQDFPRHCVFAMTTNQEEYLKDETGNRRWLPVAVVFAQADIEWLKENRDQLFAEAYHRAIELRETVYEFPEEATLAAQQSRRIHDENQDVIGDWYYNSLSDAEKDKGITIHQVYREALGNMFGKSIDRYQEMKIAEVLKTLGLERRRSMVGGYRATKWFSKDAPVEVELTRGMTAEEVFKSF